MKGFLFTLEDINGSGKSTQATLLKLRLERMDLAIEIIKAKEASQNHAFHNFMSAFDLRDDSLGYMFVYQALHSNDKSGCLMQSLDTQFHNN